MPREWLCVMTIVLCACASSSSSSSVRAPASPAEVESDFRAFLPRWEEAQTQFLNGDDTAWKRMCSQTEDATIFGAFGGREKGWAEVGPRFDWAASQFKPSGAKKRFEYLSVVARGDLALTVSIERDEPHYSADASDAAPPQTRGLRVTQVFRRDPDGWKLVHRHADPLIEKKAPGGPAK